MRSSMPESMRYQKEREFHGRAFSQGTRAGLDKFYAVARSSRTVYEQFLESRCPAKRVLEYGCGTGNDSLSLARQGAIVTGIDLSDVAIEQAKHRARREQLADLQFAVMNAEALEYEDDSFDLICGMAILHHLDLRRALSELARTLKPDGAAIFVEPLGHNPILNLYRRLTPQLRTEDEHPLLMRDLELMRVYFGTLETRFFHLHSLVAVPFREWPGFPRVLRALDAADRTVFRWVPFVRRYAWSVVLVLSNPKKARS